MSKLFIPSIFNNMTDLQNHIILLFLFLLLMLMLCFNQYMSTFGALIGMLPYQEQPVHCKTQVPTVMMKDFLTYVKKRTLLLKSLAVIVVQRFLKNLVLLCLLGKA